MSRTLGRGYPAALPIYETEMGTYLIPREFWRLHIRWDGQPDKRYRSEDKLRAEYLEWAKKSDER